MLRKPDHLHGDGDWLAGHAFGLAALVLGIAAFVVVAVAQDAPWATPDPRISVPAFAITAATAGASLARRERAYSLVLGGLGLAGASLVLGWVLMLAIVVGVTGVLMLIVHSMM
jgi:hypothetical protein